jgi:hypothetical protein
MSLSLKHALAAATLALCACAQSPVVENRAQLTPALTVTELIATAETRVGQKVTLVGYFTFRTDTRALWLDHEAYLDVKQQRRGTDFAYWSKCVTIYPRLAGASRFSDRVVRITGKVAIINKDDMRSFWTCNPVALEDATITPL